MAKKAFPTFWALLFVVALFLLLDDLGLLSYDIPWFPIILIVVAIGGILDNYLR